MIYWANSCDDGVNGVEKKVASRFASSGGNCGVKGVNIMYGILYVEREQKMSHVQNSVNSVHS